MKQNKLLAVLLALLLCAMLPLSAMAATEYSFQLIPGDDMASVDAIKDLFDVLTVRFLKGEGSGMLTLSLSGEDVFSAATRMTGDGLYLDSAILGDKPVYASAEDIGQVLTQLASAEEGMTQETLNQIKPMIAHLFSQAGMMSELKGMALADPSVTPPAELKSDELREQLQKLYGDDPAMLDYVLGILDRAEITEGSFTSDAHDPATQSIKITLTKDDVAKLQSSSTVRKALTQTGAVTEEEAAAELKKAMDNMEKMDVLMTLYADDSHLVALEMTMDSAMTVTDDDGETERESVQMTAAYNRLTKDIIRRRCKDFWNNLKWPLPLSPHSTAYYQLLDVSLWAKEKYSEGFAEWLMKNFEPIDILFRLAENPNVVLLPGEGFDAPDWSVRVSLANLPDHAYREIGRDLVTILDEYYSQYKKA